MACQGPGDKGRSEYGACHLGLLFPNPLSATAHSTGYPPNTKAWRDGPGGCLGAVNGHLQEALGADAKQGDFSWAWAHSSPAVDTARALGQ